MIFNSASIAQKCTANRKHFKYLLAAGGLDVPDSLCRDLSPGAGTEL